MVLSPALQALLKSGRAKYASHGGKMLKFKEGKTLFRVLPAHDDAAGKFWADLGVHWIKATKDGKPVAVTGCHEKVYDKPCDVCNAVSKAIDSCVDTASEEIMKEWRSRKSALITCIIRDGADKSETAQVVEVPATVIDQIMGTMQTYADAGLDALDPDTGVDFIVERSGKGFDTKYQLMVAPLSKPLNQAQYDGRVDLMAVIEKEHFRGEDAKALNSIAQISGISITGAAGLALTTGRASALALASSVAKGAGDFEGATEAPAVIINPNPTVVIAAAKPPGVVRSKPVEAAAPVVAAPVVGVVRTKPVEVAAPVVAAQPVQVAPVAAAVPEATPDEMAALLADLDGMTAA